MSVESGVGVATPGVKRKVGDPLRERKLDAEMTKRYRMITARANYMTQDRADTMYAVKEVARGMANPTEADWQSLKRLARYLKKHPRMVIKYGFQNEPEVITIMTDSDYAGCLETRKSTSGGAAKYGGHLLKGWSSTQAVVALSSGEAEYYALVKGTAQALGIQSMLRDMGVKVGIKLATDSTAAMGIAARTGLGKIRHMDVQVLWVQRLVRDKRVSVEKIPGVGNGADLMTKSWDQQTLHRLIPDLGLEFRTGRALSAPELVV